jgi:hypothetical protein
MKLVNQFKAAVMNLVIKTVENPDFVGNKLLALLENNFQKLTMSPQPVLERVSSTQTPPRFTHQ